jgi:PAS domain S-box-containing protein
MAIPPRGPRHHAPAPARHVVQFYEDEHFLRTAVADHLAAGLASGQPVVIVAASSRLEAFSSTLEARGFDVERLSRGGRLLRLDAERTLDAIMVGPTPDAAAFAAVVGGAIARSLEGSGHTTVRVYGDMVDLLWRAGNASGAARLEELWNELSDTHEFSLLCAYAMDSFHEEAHAEPFQRICALHERAIPTERYTQHADEASRLLEISVLQQRARALESEIEHRKQLERVLRDALLERRRAEETLHRSEREIEDFLENAAEGIHWAATDGTILWANAAELELLGYAREEYVGRHIAEFHADQSVIAEMRQRLGQQETLRDFPATLRCKDGSVKHVLINSNVLFRDGEFVHTRCFTHDVTALERAAAERERLLALEQAARADAEAASRAKSEFLAVMSHELRTPLNAIGGYVQLIEMGVHGSVNEAQRAALGRVQRSQRHLLALINDLLNLARVESGRVDYALEEIPLAPLLADVTAMVEPLLWRDALTCEVAADDGGAALAVLADREKLQQILLNLLSNAGKFTPAGGHVTVRAEASGDAPDQVRIQVRDTGIGIPVGKLESIFEPFVQLAVRPANAQGGVGLGLAISRDLARGMGGELTAASAPREGATFTLTLPRA